MPSTPPLSHIFYIMMENHGLNDILGNTIDAPYLNQLADSYGSATRYFGVTHPSLPNYLAAISGSFQGIWDDCPGGATVTCAPQVFGGQLTAQEANQAASAAHLFTGQNLVDQLEGHGLIHAICCRPAIRRYPELRVDFAGCVQRHAWRHHLLRLRQPDCAR
jgi:hypothetical protein